MKLSDYLWSFLKRHGVEHVFLLPGGGCMHLVDSLSKSGIDYTVCLHEQACAIAADGYAQATGKLGVVLVTSGPGATNAITGVTGSWIDSVPILVISGQVKRADLMEPNYVTVHSEISRDKESRVLPDITLRFPPIMVRQRGPQEVDIISMVEGITKLSVTVTEPDNFSFILSEAIQQAMTPRRGPVWLDIPLDVQSADLDFEDPCGDPGVEGPPSSESGVDNQISKAIGMIERAERPVILAGAGIDTPNARGLFHALIGALGIPVLTTWRSADLMWEDHILYFGRPGTITQKRASLILQDADLLISIGARLDELQVGFNYPSWGPKRKIIVDVDNAELNKRDPNGEELRIQCQSGYFLEQMINANFCYYNQDWFDKCGFISIENHVFPKKYPRSDFINPYQFIEELAKASRPEDIIVPASSGSAAEMMAQTWPIKMGQRFIFSPGLGSMGWGLPQAIGVAIGSRRRVICVIGDGDLQHNIQELQTLALFNLPIKLFVWNNGGYNSIRNSMTAHFNNPVCCGPGSGVVFPGIQDVARACALSFYQIKTSWRMPDFITSILNSDWSEIIEVFIDPDVKTEPRLHSKLMPDGSMKTEAF